MATSVEHVWKQLYLLDDICTACDLRCIISSDSCIFLLSDRGVYLFGWLIQARSEGRRVCKIDSIETQAKDEQTRTGFVAKICKVFLAVPILFTKTKYRLKDLKGFSIYSYLVPVLRWPDPQWNQAARGMCMTCQPWKDEVSSKRCDLPRQVCIWCNACDPAKLGYDRMDRFGQMINL